MKQLRPALFLSLCVPALLAQESQVPQFHGFLTESFVYSNTNNYLGMNTSSGTPDWTEAALDVNEQLTPKLRVGVQVHTTRFGQYGSWTPGIDWALADYSFNQHVGVRLGKVKIRWGLYNDTQDADPGYLWSLLPEPIYALDWRATDLAQIGGELYGQFRLGRGRGDLEYSTYYGYYIYAPNDGDLEGFHEQGLDFAKRPRGITPGFDLRWKTPLRGLKVGASLMAYNAHGTLVDGAFRLPMSYWPTYYAQYDKRKFFVSAQYMSLVQPCEYVMGDIRTSDSSDNHAWFVMAGYRITGKLQVGAYYTKNALVSAPDPSDPSSRFRDWVVSGRYDLNSYFYTKLEGHFISGTGLGFYGFDNPDGPMPRTNLLVAKVGFSF